MTILKNLVVVCNLPFYFSKLSNLFELLIFKFSFFNFLIAFFRKKKEKIKLVRTIREKSPCLNRVGRIESDKPL